MPKFKYECPVCQKVFLRYKRIVNFDVPEFCVHFGTPVEMKRLFTASFQIIANREVDKPENDLYGILTRGGDQSDRMKLIRQDAAQMEKDMDAMPAPQKEFTTEDILDTGIIEAAQSGQEGLANWRRSNIPPAKVYKEGEVIGL